MSHQKFKVKNRNIQLAANVAGSKYLQRVAG